MDLFGRRKVLSYEKARKLIDSGEYDDYHFEPIETKNGLLTGEYRLIKIQRNIKRENGYER